jgi:UDP-4-amino-4-deoxy-L-arabinose-oxoglutarate aminotransferase
MLNNFLPFTKPAVCEEAIAAVSEVLRSGWITTGPKCEAFEKALCDYTGAPDAVAVCSATAGMHCVLKAMDIGPGDEVITPSLTWVSTINLIVLAGATPVFADIDKDTLMISAGTIEKLITDKTKLIIPVHYAGAAADLDAINDIAAKYSIPVVQDAAHAMGTFYKGKHVGSTGTAIFSFHAIKNLTTAEGGMVVSDDPALMERVRRLKFHGLGRDAYDRNTQGRSPQAQVIEPGYKYNMTDITAAIGLSQMAHLAEYNAARTVLAEKYLELFADVDEILPLELPGYEFTHAWHLFIVRVDSPNINRNDFMENLKKYNVGTGLHFQAAHVQKYYREAMPQYPGKLPNTEYNSDRICSLPLFPGMTEEDVIEVVNAVRQVLEDARK